MYSVLCALTWRPMPAAACSKLCSTNNSIKHQLFFYTQLNDQTVLFETIQFSISTKFKSHLFYLTHRWDPFRCYHPDQSGLGSDGNERVLYILKSSCITETSPTVYLVSYLGDLLGGVLHLCIDAVSVFCCPCCNSA